MTQDWRKDPRFKNIGTKKEGAKIRKSEKISWEFCGFVIIAIIALLKLFQRFG